MKNQYAIGFPVNTHDGKRITVAGTGGAAFFSLTYKEVKEAVKDYEDRRIFKLVEVKRKKK